MVRFRVSFLTGAPSCRLYNAKSSLHNILSVSQDALIAGENCYCACQCSLKEDYDDAGEEGGCDCDLRSETQQHEGASHGAVEYACHGRDSDWHQINEAVEGEG